MAGHVDVRVYAELNDFLQRESRGLTLRRPFQPHQTVKDVLEASGTGRSRVVEPMSSASNVGYAAIRSPAPERCVKSSGFPFTTMRSTSVCGMPIGLWSISASLSGAPC